MNEEMQSTTNISPGQLERIKREQAQAAELAAADVADSGVLEKTAEKTAPARASQDSDKKQSTLLLGLVNDVKLFHDGVDAFADINFDDHRETMALRSQFRQWLKREYWVTFGAAPAEQAMQECLGVLEGRALYDGVEHKACIRVAQHDDKVYLDLANAEGSVVEISPSGWKVVTSPPVRFVRRNGMLPLPLPERGGNLADLRKFVNVGSDKNFLLLVSALVGGLHPEGPYIVLLLVGEQGSAKSTTAKIFRALIDPNKVPLRLTPRDETDVMIAARNAWCVMFDNVSSLSDRVSDALCVIATGGGLGKRQLYTDAEESLISVTRPILLNGIGDVAHRGDLLDRAVILEQPPLKSFRDEREFYADFERVRPRLLGAMLNAVSVALRERPRIKLADRTLRMADFAHWVVAAESALPWDKGDFEKAYATNRKESIDIALDTPVVHALHRLLDKNPKIECTATDLLEELIGRSEERTVRSKAWPTNPRTLGNELRRVAPALRRTDVSIDFIRKSGGNRDRLIQIERVGN